MTRTERIATNPNHHVGHHPLINSDQLDPYYPEEEGRRPGASSAFNDATFHNDGFLIPTASPRGASAPCLF